VNRRIPWVADYTVRSKKENLQHVGRRAEVAKL